MTVEKALEMKNIFKSFGGVHALVDVNLEIIKGKVNILMGENGAGKSTLMKILSGAIVKDKGEIFIDGNASQIYSPKDAYNYGIAMIYQELNLVPSMTVESNLSLGKEKTIGPGFIKYKESIKRAQKLLDSYEININAKEEVKNLSIAEQQMLEIAKALALDAKIIIMDEPTSSLTNKEVGSLFKIIRRLTAEGKTIIYISHRMDEVFEIGDFVTVMRDGSLVGQWPIGEVNQQKLISYMVGRTINNLYPKEEVPIGDVILRVEGLTKEGMFKDISFELHKGEILGFSGLIGAGRTEVAMSIFGAIPLDRGEITLRGEKIKIDSPAKAMDLKIAYIPEDRKNLALDLRAKISDNISLVNMDKVCKKIGYIKPIEEKKLCDAMVQKFKIKTPSIAHLANSLSGGNQQKVVLAKWLARDVDVLILDEPTRGIDVGSKEEIHRLIINLARQGLGIILISSELPEILGMSDRIAVMYEGELKAIIDSKDADQETVMTYSVNAK